MKASAANRRVGSALAALLEPCFVQASGILQGTAGLWYDFYKGKFGKMRIGASYSYSKLHIFNLPSENENIVMLSFRYYF